jgi:hypothetical protein
LGHDEKTETQKREKSPLARHPSTAQTILSHGAVAIHDATESKQQIHKKEKGKKKNEQR